MFVKIEVIDSENSRSYSERIDITHSHPNAWMLMLAMKGLLSSYNDDKKTEERNVDDVLKKLIDNGFVESTRDNWINDMNNSENEKLSIARGEIKGKRKFPNFHNNVVSKLGFGYAVLSSEIELMEYCSVKKFYTDHLKTHDVYRIWGWE